MDLVETPQAAAQGTLGVASDVDALQTCQKAIVRALVAEIAHYAPSDRRAAALREQLDEERRRLERLRLDASGSRQRPLNLRPTADPASSSTPSPGEVRGSAWSG
jgi:hypothetical protein